MSTRTRSATATGWRESLLVFAGSALVGAYAYWLQVLRPTAQSSGFFEWYDQSQYLGIAQALAAGHLPDAQHYTYGLGFPALAAPFAAVGMRTDPFILPDLLLLAGTMLAVYAASARLAGRAVALTVVLLLLAATPLVELTVVPWSSTVSIFCLAVAFWIVTRDRGLTVWTSVVFGVLAAWSFASRFVDVIPILAVGLYAVIADRTGHRVKHALFMSVPAAVGAAAVFFSQYLVFGSPLTTPYASHLRPDGTSDQSLDHYSLGEVPRHFYETFVSATMDGHRIAATPLLAISPFLVFVPLGIWAVLRRSRFRGLHITMIAMTAALSALYLSFVAGGGGDLLFHNARYWIPFYPYWTLLAVLGARWALTTAWSADRRPWRRRSIVAPTDHDREAAPVTRQE